MPYAAVADVAALIKNLDSYTDVGEAELARVLLQAESEINSLLDSYYRAPLTIDPGRAEFLTTLSAPSTAGATTVTLTAVSTATSPQDGRPRALTPNSAIYLEPGTAVQERAVIRSISGTTLTLYFPAGRSPITQSGLLYGHSAGATIVVSSSLDALFVAATHLAMAILMETYLAAVDATGKTHEPNRWRMVAIGAPAYRNTPAVAGIMAEVADGSRQFFDAVNLGNQPSYPPGLALGTELNWDGQTVGAVGAPVFYKEHSVVFDPKDYT